MYAAGLLCRDREPVFKPDLALVIVFKPDQNEIFLRKRIYVDHTFPVIFDLQLALNGIVDRISEDRADVHHIHKAEKFPVDHTGHIDLMLHAAEIFAGEHRIQHLVPRLVQGFIIMDLMLQFVQVFPLFCRTAVSPQGDNMIFKVMIPVIDHIHGALRLFVLLILAVQDRLDRLQLPLDI